MVLPDATYKILIGFPIFLILMLVKEFKKIHLGKKHHLSFMAASILFLPLKQVSMKFCLLVITLLHVQAAVFFLFSGTDTANNNSCLLKKIHIISTISSINSLHHLVEAFYKNATNAFVIIPYSSKFLPIRFWRSLPGEAVESPDTVFQTTFCISNVRKCDVGNNSA